MSSTLQELRRLRTAADQVAAKCGFYATVTKQQRLGKDTEYLETEWQVFAWSKPSEVAFMAISRHSEAEVLKAFVEAQCSFVERLDSQLATAKEAYESATRSC